MLRKSREAEWSSENVESVKTSRSETKYCVGVCVPGGGRLTYKYKVSTSPHSAGSYHCCLLRSVTKPVAHLLSILKNTSRNQVGFSKHIWWVQILWECLKQKWFLWVGSFKYVHGSLCLWSTLVSTILIYPWWGGGNFWAFVGKKSHPLH